MPALPGGPADVGEQVAEQREGAVLAGVDGLTRRGRPDGARPASRAHADSSTAWSSEATAARSSGSSSVMPAPAAPSHRERPAGGRAPGAGRRGRRPGSCRAPLRSPRRDMPFTTRRSSSSRCAGGSRSSRRRATWRARRPRAPCPPDRRRRRACPAAPRPACAVAVERALRVGDLVGGDAVAEGGERRAVVDVAGQRGERPPCTPPEPRRRPTRTSRPCVRGGRGSTARSLDAGGRGAVPPRRRPRPAAATATGELVLRTDLVRGARAVTGTGRGYQGDQAAAEAQRDGLGAVVDAELAEQPAGVRLDGVLGQVEVLADLAVALALAHAGQHLELALGQLAAGRRRCGRRRGRRGRGAGRARPGRRRRGRAPRRRTAPRG